VGGPGGDPRGLCRGLVILSVGNGDRCRGAVRRTATSLKRISSRESSHQACEGKTAGATKPCGLAVRQAARGGAVISRGQGKRAEEGDIRGG